MKCVKNLSVLSKLGILVLGLAISFSIWHLFSNESFPVSTRAEDTSNRVVYGYKTINSFPHDTESFTQGLIMDDGFLYESTGLNGRSSIKIVNLETGKVIKSHKLADKYFGEGITIVDDKIIQLTWRSKKGFVYDKDSLKLLRTFSYQTQGWGITYDGKYLILSDGSNILYFMDPKSFLVVGKLEVYDDNGEVSKLNELEYINGEIYANIWGTDLIARINPKTGFVSSWIELDGLLSKEDKKKGVDVLNGIAFNPQNETLLVTGKLWPKIFEIKIIKKN
ncbi:MAG: glutaminyl-peptide cyclotransferase [Thermodesulfobacteriota bacterium]